MTIGLRQDQAAALLGLTTRRLQQMDKSAEGPPRDANGGYLPDELGRWFRQRILSELGVANDGQVYDYEAERARLTKAQADKTELEVRELQGELIKTAVAIDQVEAMIAAMRARLLSIPSKLAPQVCADPAELPAVRDLLREQIHEALAEIASDRFHDVVRARVPVAAGDEGGASAADIDGERVVGRRAPVKS